MPSRSKRRQRPSATDAVTSSFAEFLRVCDPSLAERLEALGEWGARRRNTRVPPDAVPPDAVAEAARPLGLDPFAVALSARGWIEWGFSAAAAIQMAVWLESEQRAKRAVGEKPRDRLRWLFLFAESGSQRRNVVEELFAFSFGAVTADEVAPFVSASRDRPAAEARAYAEQEIRELQAQVGELWRSLKHSGHVFTFPVPVIDGLVAVPAVALAHDSDRQHDDDISQDQHGAALRVLAHGGPSRAAAFWASVLRLFLEVGTFRFCRRAACARPFVPRRPWQAFCDPKCESRERQARWRARQGEQAAAMRRKRYEKSVRATHPNAKIDRRPRRRSKPKGD